MRYQAQAGDFNARIRNVVQQYLRPIVTNRFSIVGPIFIYVVRSKAANQGYTD